MLTRYSADMRGLFALFASLTLAACSPDVLQNPLVDATHVARVAVYEDGRVTLNDRAASIVEIRETFAELSRVDGAVWYYREAADREPHPNAMLVLEAIASARLPVSMSTRSDFSDVVLPDGSVTPR